MRPDTGSGERAVATTLPNGRTASADVLAYSAPAISPDLGVKGGDRTPMAAALPITRAVRTEGALQIAIMLAIGGAAGGASFTHVHNVAATHGQGGWLAWADAIVLELMSVASGLEMRRRKRHHKRVRFPAVVLTCAVALSLGAQVVEAERSMIGWIAAALPALGFLVMVKIALGYAATTALADSGDLRLDPAGGASSGAALPVAHDALGEPASVASTASTPPPVPGRVIEETDHGVPWRPAHRPARSSPTDADSFPGRGATHELSMVPVERAPAVRPRLAPASPDPTPPSHPSRRTPMNPGDARPSAMVKVPATVVTLLGWANTWTRMCADGDLVLGPINDDERARVCYQLSARQLRNIRTAAQTGALRHQAARLGITLPADYVDSRQAQSADGHTPSSMAA